MTSRIPAADARDAFDDLEIVEVEAVVVEELVEARVLNGAVVRVGRDGDALVEEEDLFGEDGEERTHAAPTMRTEQRETERLRTRFGRARACEIGFVLRWFGEESSECPHASVFGHGGSDDQVDKFTLPCASMRRSAIHRLRRVQENVRRRTAGGLAAPPDPIADKRAKNGARDRGTTRANSARMELQLQSESRSDDPRRVLRHELQRFFDHRGLTAWIGCDVMVVQKDVALHADVAVALGAEPRVRRAWVSEFEGRSIDVAFRLVSGRSRLAALTSAARHVELGAAEGYAFHPHEPALWGYHRHGHVIDAMPVGRGGSLRSRVLGAELIPLPGRVRMQQIATDLAASILRLERAIERVAASA